MRLFHWPVFAVLAFVAVFSFFQGWTAYRLAQSVMHEIYAALWFLNATVCLAACGTILALSSGFARLRAAQRPDQPRAAEPASPEPAPARGITRGEVDRLRAQADKLQQDLQP